MCTNNEKWNEICFLLSDDIRNGISNESFFEQKITEVLRVLNWKQYSGDIEIRPSFQIGAAKRITPDFVIKNSDNRKLFVIEIKQPNIPLNSGFQKQLFSYMRQLKLEYGILIGQEIQIFYDGDLAKQEDPIIEDPILLETIKFTKDNEKGLKFVEIFTKENFNRELLRNFTINGLKNLNRKKEHNELTRKLLNKNYQEKISELIKQDFLDEYDGELIESVLKNLKIEIRSKNTLQSELPKREFSTKTNTKPNITRTSSKKREVNGMKIGQYVQYSFREAFEQNLLSDSEINELQKLEYSKRIFNSSFEVLRNKKLSIQDNKGRNRYYKEIFCGNYYLTSQWFEHQWELLLDWLKKIGYERDTHN